METETTNPIIRVNSTQPINIGATNKLTVDSPPSPTAQKNSSSPNTKAGVPDDIPVVVVSSSSNNPNPVNDELRMNVEACLECPSVSILTELWKMSRGNESVKRYISEHLSRQLVTLARNEEMSPAASRLLRSITVNRESKNYFQPLCVEFIEALKATDNPVSRLALTASVWNISSLKQNREILIRDTNVLEVLSGFLLIKDLELMIEVNGAIRNFTLDEMFLPLFAGSEIIENLVSVLSLVSKCANLQESKLVSCIIQSLRNISVAENTHGKLSTPESIRVLINVFLNTRDAYDKRYILEILSNISTNEKYRASFDLPELTEMLFPLLNVDEYCVAVNSILNNLKIHFEASQALKRTRSRDLLAKPETYIKSLMADADDDNISEEKIILQKQVGEGAFGTVYLAEFNGYPVACKVIKAGVTTGNAEKVLEELRMMRRLKHPNLVLLMGACLSKQKQIIIVTEFASRGDLRHCLNEIALCKRVEMIHDVAVGLSWLQTYKIVHRDLKLDNILITEDWTAKITDFGLSIELPEEGATWERFGGNIKYSAPEILREREKKGKQYAYGEQTDVYSFGLIWWQILTREDPFQPRPEKYKSKEGLATYIMNGARPALNHAWPVELRTIIAACWSENPADRPTFRTILDKWNDLTIDFLCPDPLGRKICHIFWRNNLKSKPLLDIFKEKLFLICPPSKLKDKDMPLIENILREGPFDDTVSFSRFCYVVGWFGPLQTKNQNMTMFVRKIQDITSRKFFHGFLSDSQSDSKLKHAVQSHSGDENYFLVKYSMDFLGEFKICYTGHEGNGTTIHNIVIHNTEKGVQYDGHAYEDWKKLKHAVSRQRNIGRALPVPSIEYSRGRSSSKSRHF